MYRGFVFVLALAAGLVAAVCVCVGDEAVYRLDLPGRILFSSDTPAGTPNNPVTVDVSDVTAGRVFAPMSISIMAPGAQATNAIDVTGLPGGMAWSRTGPGSGVVSGAPSIPGQHLATVNVRSGGAVVASKPFTINVYDVLGASVAGASFEVNVGQSIDITPTASNVLGSVIWSAEFGSSSKPDWLTVDEATGLMSGIPDGAIELTGFRLVATDQADLTTASTDPFSITAIETCGVWNARKAAEATSWYSIAHGGGRFVAVATSGRVMTSPDGITWTAYAAPEANGWISVAHGAGRFVAVANTGTNRVMTSTDGATWTMVSVPASSWYSITYAGGQFVAVANSGTSRVMTSPDGVSWTARTAPASAWRSVGYGNGLFVAVADGGTARVATSPDGVTWTARTAEADGWRAVTYGAGRFVAVANAGTNRVMTSADGVTWTASAAPEANSWISVAYGNGVFAAVAYDGTNRVMTSPDGVTWTAKPAASASFWRSIIYAGGEFVAVANGGSKQVMTSSCPG